jgi:hypothetical protein
MLELSDESKRLVSTFFTYRNDIDIYTEDELKDKEFYKVLFQRLLGDKININDITPLGSKKNLIQRCANEPQTERKKVFIVDGDISVIHGQNVPSLNNLFILDVYCIENILFDKNSILEFIYLHCAVKSKEEIESELNFEEWLGTYSEKLIELFLHYALVDLFGGQFTLNNLQRFLQNNVFSVTIIEAYIESLKTDIELLTSKHNYETKYIELRQLWVNSIQSLFTIVSGKDYLIPMLLIKTQKFKKSKALPSIEETKFLLAHTCNLNRLGKLKAHIEKL